MRILFIALHPLVGHQPWVRRSLNIIQALADAGNDVTVLAPQLKMEFESERILLRPLFRYRFRPLRFISFWDALVKAASLLIRKKVDAVHFSGGAVCLHVLLAPFCRAPAVCDVWRSVTAPRREGRWSVFRERLERKVLARMDTITCSCPLLEEEFSRQSPSSKVCLVENAVSVIQPEVCDLGAVPVIVYEHTDSAVDSVRLVLRVFAKLRERLPEVRLIICSDQQLHSRKLDELLERLEVKHCCVFRSFEGIAAQAALLAGADALLLPESRSGYIDDRIIRYMQSGTPIVATRISSHKQFLDSSRAVLTAVGVDDLAEGLYRVMREPLLSAGMAREGQAYAVAHFTRASFNRKVRAVFNELRRG